MRIKSGILSNRKMVGAQKAENREFYGEKSKKVCPK